MILLPIEQSRTINRHESPFKKDHAFMVVTHNMQLAARVSDPTAFFYPGEPVEFPETKRMFSNPAVRRTEEYISGRFG